MRRAPPLLVKTLLLGVGLAAATVGAAGSMSGDAKKAGNTFNLVVSSTASGRDPVVVRSLGSGVASDKKVVTNPYLVPLIQNAGSLHSR